MSKRNELAQVKRPYKVEIYGLQDNYIGTLQSYDDTFLGQIIEPEIVMSDDGTQTFSCRIPKFYINPHTNFKELNPRWGATEDGTLAENIRILKVFVQIENETRIYPFLINTITDNRDSNFAVYRSVEASGLAFAELGKIGYKIELDQTLVEEEQKALDENEETKGQIIETTMDYWLQKVFPYETDSSGKITGWLTPWCYEVCMDWSYYPESRESTKVYEDGYVSSWKYNNAAGNKADLVPASYEPSKEKQRLIDVKNSNKYNISQTIAETFEVFCRYEYKCDENGHFIREYTDANGNVWTGRKVIFYNKAIKQENPLVVDYQKNLQTIKRSSDSTDVYTKLYVTPLEAEEMSDGYVTIANTAANPLYDEFILNFDYMDKQGALTDFQKEVIKEYEYKIREINLSLEVALEQLEQARVARNDVEAEQAFYDKSSSEAEERYKYYSDLANNEITNTPVVKNSKNTYPVIFFEDGKDTNIYKARLDLHGIDITGGIDIITGKTVPFEGYNSKNCEESKDVSGNPVAPIFTLGDCIRSKTVPTTLEDIKDNIVILENDYGYPQALYCNGTSTKGLAILNDEDGYIYLHLHYCPKNEYEDIRDAFARILEDNNTRQAALLAEYTMYDRAYNKALEESNRLLAIKEEQNRRLERILGPALREGYWTPDDYSGFTETKIETISNLGPVSWTFDTEPLMDEWEGSFQLGANLDPIPYPYLDYKQDLDFTTYAPDDLVLYLNKIAISDPITKSNEIGWYSIQINFVDWYVKFEKAYPVGTKYKITFVNGKPKFWIGEPNIDWKQVADEHWTPEKPKELGTNAVPPVAWYSDDTDTSISTIESQQTLYYRSHFNYCYINHKGAITPIILIHTNAEGENFSLEKGVAYNVSYGFREAAAEPVDYGVLEYRAAAQIVYPRLKINEKNVQAKSTLFMITKDVVADEEGITLDRYYDYNIIIRDSYPLITLKIGDKILPTDIYKNYFTFKYGVSRANEQLYLDAKDVAYDNSYPRYTYDLTIANLPGVFQTIDLGQLIYINDHAVGIHAATGYVSEVTLKLDQPQNDSVKVQNYKTKFEDLFNTIVAQSEAMKTNKHAYDIAASVFTQPGAIGQISGSILQTALNNNSFWLSWSATGVEITNEQGIILTNKRPYANGVYGQVILQGGGIFLSSSVDASGNRIWSAAITPDGINASLMTAGQLNTERVLVYAGENMAFQWNGEGIFAYRREIDRPKENEYVRFSQNGLHYRRPKMEKSFDEEGNEIWEAIKPEELIDVVALDWDGLTLTKNNGVKTFQIDRHTGDLTLSGTMKSANYIEGASRILNTGWKINQDGYAEFNDLFVRGTISASVFEYEETSAIGGRMFVTPTIILKSDFTKTATIKQIDGTDGNLQITVNTGVKVDEKGRITIGGKTWQKNDVVLFNGSFIQQQSFAVENEGIEYPIFEIKSLQMKITDLQNGSMTLTSIAKVNEGTTVEGVFFDRNGNSKTLADVIAELKPPADINDLRGTGDWHLLSFSRDGQQEGILLTAIEPNSGAYIDVLGAETIRKITDENGEKKDDPATGATGSTRVRLGDLSGFSKNEKLTALFGRPVEGWGLFADNVFLRGDIYADNGYFRGEIHAESGTIGSLTIEDLENKQLKIDIELGDENGFIINTSNPNYRPVIYPKLTIDNQLITGAKPDSLTSLEYFYQHSDDSIKWNTLQYGTKSWGNNTEERKYTLQSEQSFILAKYYRVGINIIYTNNGKTETLYSAACKFTALENGKNGKDGATFETAAYSYYATANENETPTATSVTWHDTIKKTGYNKDKPYLWQKTINSYSDNTTTTNIALISVYGKTGDIGRTYKLVADCNTITRDIGSAVVPTEIKIDCVYYDGKQAEAQYDTNITYEYILVDYITYEYTTDENNKTIVTPTSSSVEYNKGYWYVDKGKIILTSLNELLPNISNASSITVTLYSTKNKDYALDSISINITLGEALRDLGTIEQGKVVINEGRVTANSIVAGAITAGKIQTGAITAGALSNVGTLSLFTTKADINYPKVDDRDADGNYKYWSGDGTFLASTYDDEIANVTKAAWENNTTSGIQLSADGILMKGSKLLIDMDNFKIVETKDEEGNLIYPVTINGDITATSGEIGGWAITETALESKNQKIYLSNTYDNDNSGDTVIKITDNFIINDSGEVYLNNIKLQEGGNFTYGDTGYRVPGVIYTTGATPTEGSEGMIWLKKADSTSTGTTVSTATYSGSFGFGSSQNMLGAGWPVTCKRNVLLPLAATANGATVSGKIYYRIRKGEAANRHGGGNLTIKVLNNGIQLYSNTIQVIADKDIGTTTKSHPFSFNLTKEQVESLTEILTINLSVTPISGSDYYAANVLTSDNNMTLTLTAK